MSEKQEGYWAPADYELRLTAFELGYLAMLVFDRGPEVPINVPDEHGRPVLSDMKAVLLGKLLESVNAGPPRDKSID